jgi:hypothetical protein
MASPFPLIQGKGVFVQAPSVHPPSSRQFSLMTLPLSTTDTAECGVFSRTLKHSLDGVKSSFISETSVMHQCWKIYTYTRRGACLVCLLRA